jgi:hypothetical protein
MQLYGMFIIMSPGTIASMVKYLIFGRAYFKPEF